VASALLALAASVSWGLGDFSGGLISRRLPVAGVTFLQHSAGFATIATVALVAGKALDARAVALGALGGVFSGVGVITYYRALSIGTMSIVSPIAACGAIVTLGVALAAGERPSSLALAGVVIALTGAVLASFQEHARGGASREAVVLAVATACMFGFQLYFLGRASDDGGPVSAIFGARAVSALMLAILVISLRRRVDVSRAPLVAAILLTGVLVALANTLYGLAAERGLVSIASVLASLYPVTTLFLARFVLHERLNRVQLVGVVVALAGVAIAVLG
jgi:drug/metabolite transporter (DMT)-like permease